MKKSVLFAAMVLFGLILVSCDSGPKVIESSSVQEGNSPVLPQAEVAQNPNANQVHKIVVDEVLDTDKYTYLHVTENEEVFWVAIPKQEVQIGNTYYFSKGLLKKNFFSKEYNTVFETLYLVSDFSDHSSHSGDSAVDEVLANMKGASTAPDGPILIEPAEGAISISDLMEDPKKYEGQIVKITGKCVKVNPMIMNRNWIHIQDGSGQDLELTVTTNEVVQPGSVVTCQGVITLNKDFGAGYRYDVIMEEATLR